MLQIDSLQRSGELQIVVGHQSSRQVRWANAIQSCGVSFGNCAWNHHLRISALEVAWDGKLSQIALDPHPAVRLDDGADVVEDGTADSRRPPYRQHHGEKATVGGAEKYGRRDLERDQDGREVGECDGKRVVVGV